jgi:hypothetical protein
MAAFVRGYDGLTLCILVNGALAGFSTALLLRYLSALAKEFANAAEIVTTALLARAVLATPLPGTLEVGAAIVIGSMALYESGERGKLARLLSGLDLSSEAGRASGVAAERGEAARSEVEPLCIGASNGRPGDAAGSRSAGCRSG